ncbi:MAG: hypothetical protein ACI92S_001600 [Planctomycetaceae bacterium]|jgi:hypothetical protein
MTIPRFTADAVSPRLQEGGLDDAFQRFVAEALSKCWPDMHVFPAAGKYGGIDLSVTTHCRTVAECKIVGTDDVATVSARWQEVEERLRKHLSSPDGPTSGQSQYAPWYREDPAISEYLFCVSASPKNQARRDDVKIGLRDQIQGFFRGLADEHQHLSHLKALTVTVLDWDDLVADLSPHSIFRWFHKTRILGLLPLQEEASLQSFRAYLRSEKLPYYSRAEHLANVPAPDDVGVAVEHELLTTVRQDRYAGIIISGAGGVGKSRLMYELGYLALQDGSTVLEVSTRLKPDTLEKLAEQLEPRNDVLLLIDYIETQHDFIQFAQELASINATLELRVRYVACCRSSYFPVVQHAGDASTDFLHLDLAFDHRLADWLKSYRYGTVQHILKTTDVPDSARHLEMCGQTPVLAVFLAWLHENGRREELDELLDHENGEFGTWLTKRVQKSFPNDQSISRQLAELLSFFPMSNDQVSLLRKDETFDRLFDRLQVDGWIERMSNSGAGDDRWETGHDVLADQVLLSYATVWLTNTADQFIARLFELAAAYGVVESVLVTFQRVADLPPFDSVDWEPLLRGAAESRSDAWRDCRTSLLSTGLLPAESKIRLLDIPELWSGAEADVGFQNNLGWLARAESRQGEQYSVATRDLLRTWITKTAPHVEQSNFLLTYGLQFDPDSVMEIAQQWIESQPEKFQTHYLMVRWLKLELPTAAVETAVSVWAAKFCDDRHLTFVAQAWLDAGGDAAVVRSSIKAWLEKNQAVVEANFVYKSWLDAGGDVSFVEPSINAWLELHQKDADAKFVYKSWLDAGGDVSIVEPSIMAWLALHQTDAEAQFVYRAWLDAGGDVSIVEPSIEAWLALHQADAEARFVYKSWLDAGGAFDVVASSMLAWGGQHGSDAEADFVYRAWLENGGDFKLIRESATAWLHEHCTEQALISYWPGWGVEG